MCKEDLKDDSVNLQAVGEGKVQLSRTPQEKDRLPDRISLDRYVNKILLLRYPTSDINYVK